MESTQIEYDINTFLVFRIDNEDFAINASRVQRILEMQEITRIPKAPDLIRGIINVMNKPLPVINTRIKLGLEDRHDDAMTCIVILEIYNNKELIEIGVVVDSVQGVSEIEKEKIQSTPNFSMDINTEFIQGVVEQENKYILVLDPDQIFTKAEIVNLKNTISKSPDEVNK